jgi:Ni,Fe-hydrogenase I cytochrome b subunit
MPGEASDHYLMGYIRFAHFAAGYMLAVGLLGRAYWAWWATTMRASCSLGAAVQRRPTGARC